jgi:hypothetical protein
MILGSEIASLEHFKSHNWRGELLKENPICDIKYWEIGPKVLVFKMLSGSDFSTYFLVRIAYKA